MRQNTFEKKLAREMLIEQGPLKFKFNNTFTGTCTPTTGYFCEKTKISKANLRVDYYLLLKYCTRQCILISPT